MESDMLYLSGISVLTLEGFCVSLTLLSIVPCKIISRMRPYCAVFMQSCFLHLHTSFQEMEVTS